MRKSFRLLTFLLCITLLLPCAAASADTPRYHFDADFSQESLGDAIERYLASRYLSSYSVKIGWCDLQSGEEWYLDGDAFMECASTYKLPLAMIYVDKIAAGELTLDDKIGFSSGVGSLSPLGVILPIRMSPSLTSAPTRIKP